MSYRLELLDTALKQREREVIEYQVNIDNYRLAIERVKDDLELQDFKKQLEHLLQSSLIEQKKAQVILDVIRHQLGV